MRKLLIYTGIILIFIGVLWPWVSKIPFGRLPGDILIDKPNIKIYFPFTTMILISVILTLLMWLFRR